MEIQMSAFPKKSALLTGSIASLVLAAALTAFSVTASAAPPAHGESAGGSKMMHKAGHHKGHGKQRGHRHGMRSLLKGLDLSEAQRDQIFEIRHANMPALREQRKQQRTARQTLKTMAIQGNVDPAALQAQTDALGQAVAAMAALRVQSMNQVMNVLTQEQAVQLRERMHKRQAKGQHRGNGRGHHGNQSKQNSKS